MLKINKKSLKYLAKRAYDTIEKTPTHAKVLFFVIVLISIFYVGFVRPPLNFPTGTLVPIEKGLTLSEVSEFLDEQSVIVSPFFFESLVILLVGEGGVISGDYYFENNEGIFGIVSRVTKGRYGIDPLAVILPEGATVKEMARILSQKFPKFDTQNFEFLAQDDEGYLFPDTYFFLPNVEEAQVYHELKENFSKRITEVEEDILASGHSVRDIIIMASILEEEARTDETRRIISGILWKRIEIGMALQVDAVFPYIMGKNTFEITLEDLKIDSPYNTYRNKGLPIGPISNPGMNSILAALNPKESPYLFFLSDLDGVMHYGETFKQHKINKAKYLR